MKKMKNALYDHHRNFFEEIYDTLSNFQKEFIDTISTLKKITVNYKMDIGADGQPLSWQKRRNFKYTQILESLTAVGGNIKFDFERENLLKTTSLSVKFKYFIDSSSSWTKSNSTKEIRSKTEPPATLLTKQIVNKKRQISLEDEDEASATSGISTGCYVYNLVRFFH